MILWAFIFTLFSSLIVSTLLANLLVETESTTFTTTRMAFTTNCFTSKWFPLSLFLWSYIFIIVTIWT
uniref:Secreted protein n=1 Tax=Panstrongylus lignarius TaxID=156445 RepID=A0A224Y1G7_9HEMI